MEGITSPPIRHCAAVVNRSCRSAIRGYQSRSDRVPPLCRIVRVQVVADCSCSQNIPVRHGITCASDAQPTYDFINLVTRSATPRRPSSDKPIAVASSSSSSSSSSHFYMESIWDDSRLHAARSYASSPDSPLSLSDRL